MTGKDSPTDSKPKEKKYQTQIIRNVLRNLVRKKNSPARKIKTKSKSKNPDQKISGTTGSVSKKNKPESLASSKSRKLQKLFTRKNLSLSLENRKIREWQQKLQDIPFSSTLKYAMITNRAPVTNLNYECRSLSRPNTSKNKDAMVGLATESKLPGQFSLQNNKKLKLVNMPLSHKEGLKFSKTTKKND